MKFNGAAVESFNYEQRNGKYGYPLEFTALTETKYYQIRNTALAYLKWRDNHPILSKLLGLDLEWRN